MTSETMPADIETSYYDALGVLRHVPEGTLTRLAAALATAGEPEGAAAPLPAAPSCCHRPEWMARGQRLWGIAAQLYSLRSATNWGIGDFGDLARLIDRAAEAGADFVGVNPLHALFAAEPRRFSPYAPSSREFLNVLYLDVPEMVGYAECTAAQALVASAGFSAELDRLRQSELVDYPAVAQAKEAAFRLLFDFVEERIAQDPAHPWATGFAAFSADRGAALRRFALYQALSCRPGFGPDWRAWPEAYRDPAGAGAAAFAAAEPAALRYHAFLQWQADLQLARCTATARARGMRVGLYTDLAVGAPAASAEGWSEQARLIPGFEVGAPPDLWNENGQDWGLFAYNPRRLARDGGGAFRRVIAANMRHAGALRIDHVLGINRLFLVPSGRPPTEGVYLRFPLETLCAALAAESERHRCVVIGEDLGTVPEGLQERLMRNGMLSYRLLIFAKGGDGRFLAPQDYPRDALVAVSTHDLPTLRGFWEERDLALKSDLRLYPDAAREERARHEREADRHGIAEALARAGIADDPASQPPMIGAHRFLARTPCRLLVVQIEDLAGELEQVNLPATTDEHPNWRRKLAHDAATLFAEAPATAILAALRSERP